MEGIGHNQGVMAFGERVFEEIALDYRDSRPFGFANKALARNGARARQQYCVDDKHARQVPTGARLLLVDLWTDVTYTQPPIAPLASGEFLVISGEGQAYGEDEARHG